MLGMTPNLGLECGLEDEVGSVAKHQIQDSPECHDTRQPGLLPCRQWEPSDCFSWRCADQISVLENSPCCSGEAGPGVVLGMPQVSEPFPGE